MREKKSFSDQKYASIVAVDLKRYKKRREQNRREKRR